MRFHGRREELRGAASRASRISPTPDQCPERVDSNIKVGSKIKVDRENR
jgi:hypothetical protein